MVRVSVPATSANLGPGFDSIGLCFDLFNVFEFDEIDEGLCFEGFKEEFCNENNLIYVSMKALFNKIKFKPKGVKIKLVEQNIPIARGLGSSSSCIVAGVIGANAISGYQLSKDEILDIAVEIEGHPDNVAPALLGGLIVAALDDNKPYYSKIEVNKVVNFYALIPDFMLSTEEARKVLPKEISLKDGVYNVSRAALLVAAFAQGKYELLKIACSDKFHQPYRGKLIENYDDVMNECNKNKALSVYLSGAGPTIMAISEEKEFFKEKMRTWLVQNKMNWDIIELKINNQGAIIK
ncbi:homoserine kinase [Inconstantimicrobium mannanitabidum]|uniref:Homoserine kinase n=1 Tax=Inconstantimicrobium mannanitabidum TaxID=1604901 RepID=A0ACB5R9M0_9CLOT|nr:homoserine kinase [Clostridium sp. TW13]GKX65719.1 homoserine kinase [Clostridium sp. TW13]